MKPLPRPRPRPRPWEEELEEWTTLESESELVDELDGECDLTLGTGEGWSERGGGDRTSFSVGLTMGLREVWSDSLLSPAYKHIALAITVRIQTAPTSQNKLTQTRGDYNEQQSQTVDLSIALGYPTPSVSELRLNRMCLAVEKTEPSPRGEEQYD